MGKTTCSLRCLSEDVHSTKGRYHQQVGTNKTVALSPKPKAQAESKNFRLHNICNHAHLVASGEKSNSSCMTDRGLEERSPRKTEEQALCRISLGVEVCCQYFVRVNPILATVHTPACRILSTNGFKASPTGSNTCSDKKTNQFENE